MIRPATYAIVEFLESKEFYDLCQNYRRTPIENQKRVVEAFDDLKNEIFIAVENAIHGAETPT